MSTRSHPQPWTVRLPKFDNAPALILDAKGTLVCGAQIENPCSNSSNGQHAYSEPFPGARPNIGCYDCGKVRTYV